jgi:hypothetical protein
MSYSELHWRVVNILARLFGLMGLLVGSVFIWQGVHFIMSPLDAARINTLTGNAGIEFIIVGCFAVAVGALVM